MHLKRFFVSVTALFYFLLLTSAAVQAAIEVVGVDTTIDLSGETVSIGVNGHTGMMVDPFDSSNDSGLNDKVKAELQRQGLAKLNPANFRYPTGTIANYWDVENERAFATTAYTGTDTSYRKVLNENYDDAYGIGSLRYNWEKKQSLAGIKEAYDVSGAVPSFVCNMVTPGHDFYASATNNFFDDSKLSSDAQNALPSRADLWTVYSGLLSVTPEETPLFEPLTTGWDVEMIDRVKRCIYMLEQADSLGIPVLKVEMGNESELEHHDKDGDGVVEHYVNEAFPFLTSEIPEPFYFYDFPTVGNGIPGHDFDHSCREVTAGEHWCPAAGDRITSYAYGASMFAWYIKKVFPGVQIGAPVSSVAKSGHLNSRRVQWNMRVFMGIEEVHASYGGQELGIDQNVIDAVIRHVYLDDNQVFQNSAQTAGDYREYLSKLKRQRRFRISRSMKICVDSTTYEILGDATFNEVDNPNHPYSCEEAGGTLTETLLRHDDTYWPSWYTEFGTGFRDTLDPAHEAFEEGWYRALANSLTIDMLLDDEAHSVTEMLQYHSFGELMTGEYVDIRDNDYFSNGDPCDPLVDCPSWRVEDYENTHDKLTTLAHVMRLWHMASKGMSKAEKLVLNTPGLVGTARKESVPYGEGVPRSNERYWYISSDMDAVFGWSFSNKGEGTVVPQITNHIFTNLSGSYQQIDLGSLAVTNDSIAVMLQSAGFDKDVTTLLMSSGAPLTDSAVTLTTAPVASREQFILPPYSVVLIRPAFSLQSKYATANSLPESLAAVVDDVTFIASASQDETAMWFLDSFVDEVSGEEAVQYRFTNVANSYASNSEAQDDRLLIKGDVQFAGAEVSHDHLLTPRGLLPAGTDRPGYLWGISGCEAGGQCTLGFLNIYNLYADNRCLSYGAADVTVGDNSTCSNDSDLWQIVPFVYPGTFGDTDSDGLLDRQEILLATDWSNPDTDGDGVGDGLDAFPFDSAESEDLDRDGIGDNADADDDADEVVDAHDNCPQAYNPDQRDGDGDGDGYACDKDDNPAGIRVISDEINLIYPDDIVATTIGGADDPSSSQRVIDINAFCQSGGHADCSTSYTHAFQGAFDFILKDIIANYPVHPDHESEDPDHQSISVGPGWVEPGNPGGLSNFIIYLPDDTYQVDDTLTYSGNKIDVDGHQYCGLIYIDTSSTNDHDLAQIRWIDTKENEDDVISTGGCDCSEDNGQCVMLGGFKNAFTDSTNPLNLGQELLSKVRIVGQSRQRTVIRLEDGLEAFSYPGNPKAVLSYTRWFNYLPDTVAQNNTVAFNTLRNLTVNVGNNKGAIGVDYAGANNTGIHNVEITAEGARGAIGLRINTYTTQGYHSDLKVSHFTRGIQSTPYHATHNSFEYITLDNLGVGLELFDSGLSVRKLKSSNISLDSVRIKDNPVLAEGYVGGSLIMLDSVLEGNGENSSIRVEQRAQLLLHNVREGGGDVIDITLKDVGGAEVNVQSNVVPEAEGGSGDFVSACVIAGGSTPYSYSDSCDYDSKIENFDGIEDAPFSVYDLNTHWVNVDDYEGVNGGNCKQYANDSERVQCVFDYFENQEIGNNAVFYFPQDVYDFTEEINVPWYVEKINFLYGKADNSNQTNRSSRYLFISEGEKSAQGMLPDLHIEDLGRAGPIRILRHESGDMLSLQNLRTIAFRHVNGGESLYSNLVVDEAANKPTVFMESANHLGKREELRNVNLWGRFLNIEFPGGPNIKLGDGAQLWLMGFKTENAQPLIQVGVGSKTSILGGVVNQRSPKFFDESDGTYFIEDSKVIDHLGGQVSMTLSLSGQRTCYRHFESIIHHQPTDFKVLWEKFPKRGNGGVLGECGGYSNDVFVPLFVDLDDDALPDAWELNNGLDPEDPNHAVLNPDLDDLLNNQEYLAGTDPLNGDSDGDSHADHVDNCPTIENPNQADQDGDLVGNVCDIDVDGDGVGNTADTDDDNDSWIDVDESACGTDPLNVASVPVDTDADAVCDVVDTDDDNDGTPDVTDAFPLDPAEDTDTDGDGVGNNEDPDDDNDLWSDIDELLCGTDSLIEASVPVDTDNDSVCDVVDTDDDNDGMPDVWENNYGLDALIDDALGDFDGDLATNLQEYLHGTNPAVIDNDPDGDDVNNIVDNCLEVSNSGQLDAENDGYGNACDGDFDNNGYVDIKDLDWLISKGLGVWVNTAVGNIPSTTVPHIFAKESEINQQRWYQWVRERPYTPGPSALHP